MVIFFIQEIKHIHKSCRMSSDLRAHVQSTYLYLVFRPGVLVSRAEGPTDPAPGCRLPVRYVTFVAKHRKKRAGVLHILLLELRDASGLVTLVRLKIWRHLPLR